MEEAGIDVSYEPEIRDIVGLLAENGIIEVFEDQENDK